MKSNQLNPAQLMMGYLSNEQGKIGQKIVASEFARELEVQNAASGEKSCFALSLPEGGLAQDNAAFMASFKEDSRGAGIGGAGSTENPTLKALQKAPSSKKPVQAQQEKVREDLVFSNPMVLDKILAQLQVSAEARQSLKANMDSQGQISCKALGSLLNQQSAAQTPLVAQGKAPAEDVQTLLNSIRQLHPGASQQIQSLEAKAQGSYTLDEMRNLLNSVVQQVAQVKVAAKQKVAGTRENQAGSAPKSLDTVVGPSNVSAGQVQQLTSNLVPSFGSNNSPGGNEGRQAAAWNGAAGRPGDKTARIGQEDRTQVTFEGPQSMSVKNMTVTPENGASNSTPTTIGQPGNIEVKPAGPEHRGSLPESLLGIHSAANPGAVKVRDLAIESGAPSSVAGSLLGQEVAQANDPKPNTGQDPGPRKEALNQQATNTTPETPGRAIPLEGAPAKDGNAAGRREDPMSGSGFKLDTPEPSMDRIDGGRMAQSVGLDSSLISGPEDEAKAGRGRREESTGSWSSEAHPSESSSPVGVPKAGSPHKSGDAPAQNNGDMNEKTFAARPADPRGAQARAGQNDLNAAQPLPGLPPAGASAQPGSFMTPGQTLSLENSAWPMQMAQRFQEMQQQKRNQLTLELDPKELGKVVLRVETENNQVVAWISTDNEQAKTLLAQNAPQLRNHLEQQGLSLGEFFVDVRQGKGEQDPSRQNHPGMRQERGLPGGGGNKPDVITASRGVFGQRPDEQRINLIA